MILPDRTPTHFALKRIVMFGKDEDELCPIIRHVRDRVYNIERKDGSLMCVEAGTHGSVI